VRPVRGAPRFAVRTAQA